ncbi:MAG: glycosyl transferase family 2 [Actinomycetia bacterium]|nr:glycosyl transferase family 2 [Actinomycetes bacterium]
MPASQPLPRYVVITPVRDESAHLPTTIASMRAQTVAPALWVIIDDGSGDDTRQIANDAAGESPWIRVVSRDDRGYRAAGIGVVTAFYDGLEAVNTEWDFLVKLDGDVVLEPDYFERCLGRFAANTRLGVGGGVFHNPMPDGTWKEERAPRFHVRGGTKIYRRACWNEIGGLIRMTGWDSFDEIKANRLGWQTESFSDIVVRHQRTTGDAAGQWDNWVKNGRANFIVGYDPVFLVVRAVSRLTRKPRLTSAGGLLVGYFGSWAKREPRVDDRETIRYLRQQQRRKLTGRPTIGG